MSLTKQQLFLLLGGVAILAVVFATAFYLLTDDNGLVEIPGVERELWSRELDQDKNNNLVKITNSYDGYSIEVPQDWSVSDTASGASGLTVTYSPEGTFRENIDFAYGMQLTVYVETKNPNESLQDWVDENFGPSLLEDASVGSYSARKSSQPLIERNTFFEEVPQENSLVDRFFIQQDEKVFLLMCAASGAEYQELIGLCEAQLETFRILE